MIYQWVYLCGKLGCGHEDPSARELAAGVSFEAAESFHEVREIAVSLSIFLKRSALGAFHSACPLFCAFFRETPQMLRALHAWDPGKQHKPQLMQSFSVEAVYCIR